MKKIVVIGLSGESVFLNCDHFNELGETIKATEKFSEPGGKGFNQAIALGRLRANVSFITALGNDQYASVCEKVLLENHVKPYIIKKNTATDYAVILTNKNGENNVVVYDKTSSLVTASDILRYRNIIDEADFLLLQMEYPFSVLKEIIDYAYNKGVKVILNPAPAHIIDLATMHKLYAIIPNEFEVYNLITDDLHLPKDEKTMNIILNDMELAGVEVVICTRGEKNAIIYYNGVRKEFPVTKVETVDTTGAGDTFCAGIAYGLSLDMNMESILELATNFASLEVCKKGVLNAIPSKKELIEFIDKINNVNNKDTSLNEETSEENKEEDGEKNE